MRLELDKLCAGYGRIQVLRDVDMVVPDGAAVALLGANGAGKTTLLKTVAGLIRPSAGSITFDGTRIERESAHERARRGVCLIPEGRGIYRSLTVRENLTMQSATLDSGQAFEIAAEAFPILKERLDQLAGTLSGGQQQMVAVCRAFLSDATVVLADELSIGLAPVIVDQIFEAVGRLRQLGKSLMIVEQYASRVLEHVDYVYVLHKGRVVLVDEAAHCSASHVLERYMGSVA